MIPRMPVSDFFGRKYSLFAEKDAGLKAEGSMSFFDMPSCGGCRTCEMACSFHHRDEFNPAVASIKIIDEEGEVPFRVWLSKEGEMRTPEEIPCDGCKGIDEPFCLQFCRKKEDLKKILTAFLDSECEEKPR